MLRSSLLLATLATLFIGNASAGASIQPRRQGAFLVCPSGASVRFSPLTPTYQGPASLSDTALRELYVIGKVKNLESTIYINESKNEFNEDVVERIEKKILDGITVDSAYKLIDWKMFVPRRTKKEVKLFLRVGGGFPPIGSTEATMRFRNSGGKELTLRLSGNYKKRDSIVDSNKQKLLVELQSQRIKSRFYCHDESIGLKFVREIEILGKPSYNGYKGPDYDYEKLTNQFGQVIKPPKFFALFDITLQLDQLKKQDSFDAFEF